ncbi:BolA family protein [Thiohalorhabdus sp.]|uniref:BolA family protein n=1 Tax=Thiohalorhabdus sp. TaxID=3094134 RepID=UPI002FC36E14
MSVQETIEHKLSQELEPVHLEVLNESHMHNVPEGSESHFKVYVVSPAFEGQKRVGRQRTINRVLADELAGPVHALSLHTLTPAEWAAKDRETLASPQCLGGAGK